MSPTDPRQPAAAGPPQQSAPRRDPGPRRFFGLASNWRQSYEHSFPVDAWDPLARFIRDRLGWDWPQFLVFIFLIYGPLEKLVIPYFGGYLNLSGGIANWVPHIESLLTGFVEFPFFFAFYLWTGRGIGQIFVSLARNRSFEDEAGYEKFLARVQASYDRWWWSAISLGLALVAVALMHFVVWAPESTVPPWFGSRNTWHRVLGLIEVGLVAYVVGQILIREILALVWLQLLWNERGDELVVHPYDADEAGGLGAIGQHAINFAYFLMMVMLFIVMASLLPNFQRTGQLTLSLWSPLIALMWALYVTIVPTTFGLLIWPPHVVMKRARDEQLNAVSRQLDELLALAETQADGDPEELAATLKQIEQLKTMRTIYREDFPTWPINAQIRRQLGFSSVFPVAYSLFTLALDIFS